MNVRVAQAVLDSGDMDIFYQKTNAPYGCLQNFFVSPFMYGDRLWQTVEHCYQASKFEDIEIQERIRNQPNAYMAAMVGRDKSLPIRKDWDKGLNLRYMSAFILQKYVQCEELRKILLSTVGCNLYELSYKDQFWGTKPDKSGLNHQGRITMAVRDRLSAIA